MCRTHVELGVGSAGGVQQLQFIFHDYSGFYDPLQDEK